MFIILIKKARDITLENNKHLRKRSLKLDTLWTEKLISDFQYIGGKNKIQSHQFLKRINFHSIFHQIVFKLKRWMTLFHVFILKSFSIWKSFYNESKSSLFSLISDCSIYSFLLISSFLKSFSYFSSDLSLNLSKF